MAWIPLTSANVLAALTGPEVTALQTAALGSGQPDPLADMISKVIQEVRGYVAGNQMNRLGASGTIPEELEADAIAIIRYRALNRLPDVGLLTEARRAEYRDAIAHLKDIARGLMRIELPATPTTQIIAGPAVQLASKQKRELTRRKMRGL
jgi:hypothetical protein